MPQKHPIVQKCLDPGKHDKAVKHVSPPFAAWFGTSSELKALFLRILEKSLNCVQLSASLSGVDICGTSRAEE